MEVDGIRVENLTLYGRVGGFEQVAQDLGEVFQKVSRDNTVIYHFLRIKPLQKPCTIKLLYVGSN